MTISSATLQTWFPHTTAPFLCNAPMYGSANAELAAAVTKAGGFGFIGGGFDFSPSSSQIPALSSQLSSARAHLGLENSESTLPVGIGLITFGPGDPVPALLPLLSTHRPAAVWLFAPASRDRHTALISAFKAAGASWNLKVFVQVGTVQAAREAVEDGCDVVVAQGNDAGGHQWAQGASLISLVPEVVNMLREEFGGNTVSVLAAGGIAEGRGFAAGLVLGANGAVMGTRFLVTTECASTEFAKNAILSATDGGVATIKSTIHDTIQGTGFWPAAFDGRAIIGESYKDYLAGVSEEENIIKYKDAIKAGDNGRRIVWAGSGVGLIKSVLSAGEVVVKTQTEAKDILDKLQRNMTFSTHF